MKISIITFFISINIFSQINIKIGSEHRITPIYIKNEDVFENQSIVSFSEHRLLTGTSFNYTIEYINKTGYGIGFSQFFQYSHIYYEQKEYGVNGIKKSVNGILTDFNFYLKKQFYISKNKYIFFEIGQSLMNSGSSFVESKVVGYYTDGNPILFEEDKDFNFFATNVNIGYNYKNIDLSVGAYFTKGSEFFSTRGNSTLILPFLKIDYIIKSFD